LGLNNKIYILYVVMFYMGFEDLDLKDRKLLYQLDINCRQTDSEIGKKIGLSKQSVAYRIDRLFNSGYISYFTSVIDTYKLGYSKYKLYLSLKDIDGKKFSQIIDFLKKEKKSEGVAICSGKWDLIVGYLVKDEYDFQKCLKSLNNKFGKFVSSREISVSLGVPHWRRNYLVAGGREVLPVFQGGEKNNIKLDFFDDKLIRLIANNARMSVVKMATKLKSSPRKTSYRIRNLISKKVILLNRVALNLDKIGFIRCKSFVIFKNINEESYREFLKYCNSLPNLTYLINCLGSWDVELEFEVEDFVNFHKLMKVMKNKFFNIIESYDFVIVTEDSKLDYYPGALPPLTKF